MPLFFILSFFVIYSSRQNRLKPVGNLPPPPIFLYRVNLSLSLATTFHQGAFGVDLNLTASNISLSFSIFFLFFLFFIFCFFFPTFLPTTSSSNIPNFYFFRIFFADFCTEKQPPLLDAVSFLVQFFLSIFYAY